MYSCVFVKFQFGSAIPNDTTNTNEYEVLSRKHGPREPGAEARQGEHAVRSVRRQRGLPTLRRQNLRGL